MASAQDLRKRIKSVTNTQQITKAMKMVASARLRRAQLKAQSTRPYALKLADVLRHVAGSPTFERTHPMLRHDTVKRTGYLIIGADKGLAGAYTSNLIKYMVNELSGKTPDQYALVTVGRKPRDYMKSRGYTVKKSFYGYSDKPSYEHAKALTKEIAHAFLQEEVDEVVMVYTEFINSLTQQVRECHLLPFSTPEAHAAGEREYFFMPDGETIFNELVPKYLEITIYNGLLQSAASELGARMTAMTSSTDNAGELINKLNLEYNKLRQAGITNEISEIVGGANALQ
ncbi:ATP F0F1 synthase subunit gamma [Veillonella montpellierensis DNF00314]|uniref:ATP synthase gamma chain n=1 Tax=Veillonella montpellierensis DNF00314 TaxID=1401067 RepID=A0A096AKE2_9FIRM|nr:ATP synthase F1 subunit gamma [Veillonella montpellierensis]KGF47270.1 ATP F0F1 synthase subunit gamma [Veillonella montpellierensis DNF00314]